MTNSSGYIATRRSPRHCSHSHRARVTAATLTHRALLLSPTKMAEGNYKKNAPVFVQRSDGTESFGHVVSFDMKSGNYEVRANTRRLRSRPLLSLLSLAVALASRRPFSPLSSRGHALFHAALINLCFILSLFARRFYSFLSLRARRRSASAASARRSRRPRPST